MFTSYARKPGYTRVTQTAAKVLPSSGCVCNRYELCHAMFTRDSILLGGVLVVINGISAEDGSGHSFNVTYRLAGDTTSRVVHVRG
jgi:hypothetical protein